MRRFKRITEVGVEKRFNSFASSLDPKLPMEPAAGESQSTEGRFFIADEMGMAQLAQLEEYLETGSPGQEQDHNKARNGHIQNLVRRLL